MKNAEQLRTALASVFSDLRAKRIAHKDAGQLASLAGKMIGSARAQIEYAKLRKETPDIEFLRSSRK